MAKIIGKMETILMSSIIKTPVNGENMGQFTFF
jgi:hypothetical protein